MGGMALLRALTGWLSLWWCVHTHSLAPVLASLPTSLGCHTIPAAGTREFMVPGFNSLPGSHALSLHAPPRSLSAQPSLRHGIFYTARTPSLVFQLRHTDAVVWFDAGRPAAGTFDVCLVLDVLATTLPPSVPVSAAPGASAISCAPMAPDAEELVLPWPLVLQASTAYHVNVIVRAKVRLAALARVGGSFRLSPTLDAVSGELGEALASKAALPPPPAGLGWLHGLQRFEYGVWSQNGEDGVLATIFKAIGLVGNAHTAAAAPSAVSGSMRSWLAGGGSYVEFGAEDGQQCNTRVLREDHGWSGLLMDGGHANPAINLQREWVTAESINLLLSKHRVPPVFDLLVVDIDFNDYWVWQALLQAGQYRPRVVVVEINANLGSERAMTVRSVPSPRALL